MRFLFDCCFAFIKVSLDHMNVSGLFF
jgi:hypothetical protein